MRRMHISHLMACGGPCRPIAPSSYRRRDVALTVADLGASCVTSTVAATSREERRLTKQGVMTEWIADARIEQYSLIILRPRIW